MKNSFISEVMSDILSYVEDILDEWDAGFVTGLLGVVLAITCKHRHALELASTAGLVHVASNAVPMSQELGAWFGSSNSFLIFGTVVVIASLHGLLRQRQQKRQEEQFQSLLLTVVPGAIGMVIVALFASYAHYTKVSPCPSGSVMSALSGDLSSVPVSSLMAIAATTAGIVLFNYRAMGSGRRSSISSRSRNATRSRPGTINQNLHPVWIRQNNDFPFTNKEKQRGNPIDN